MGGVTQAGTFRIAEIAFSPYKTSTTKDLFFIFFILVFTRTGSFTSTTARASPNAAFQPFSSVNAAGCSFHADSL